jgi:hypoxanthine phosphoribosyltransferase
MKRAAAFITKSQNDLRTPFHSFIGEVLTTRAGMQDYEEVLAEILIDEPTLQRRVAELGAEISADYQGDKNLLLICILRGGVPFLVDLSRHITVAHMMDFMAVSSYGTGNRESTGNVRVTFDLQTNIKGKDVLLVEDIVDSGHTIASVLGMLETRQPASLKVCTLLDKAERREAVVPIHYRGFTIPNRFVFGYGLDLDEYYRNLPFIGVVDLLKYHPG